MTETKIAPIVLPTLDWHPTTASSDRRGEKIVRVVLHRWGVKYTTPHDEARSYDGVITYFKDPLHQASAHIVFPGSAVTGRATQMVPWAKAAWAEAAFNRSSVEIECADAIWLGHDPHGLHVAARITAYLLHKNKIPARWSAEHGFCRHADLGTAGGGHTACPTTDPHLFHAFEQLVLHETARGGFRETWGR